MERVHSKVFCGFHPTSAWVDINIICFFVGRLDDIGGRVVVHQWQDQWFDSLLLQSHVFGQDN